MCSQGQKKDLNVGIIVRATLVWGRPANFFFSSNLTTMGSSVGIYIYEGGMMLGEESEVKCMHVLSFDQHCRIRRSSFEVPPNVYFSPCGQCVGSLFTFTFKGIWCWDWVRKVSEVQCMHVLSSDQTGQSRQSGLKVAADWCLLLSFWTMSWVTLHSHFQGVWC